MMKKLLRQLQNRHFLSLAGNAIMSGLGMLTIAILCRRISPEVFGTWVFFQGTLLFIDTFRSGFITTAFIKFYAGASREKAAAVVGAAWFIAVIITLVLSLVSLIAVFFLHSVKDEGVRLLATWFAPAFWMMLPYFMATCIAQGDQRFDRLLYLRFANQGLFIVAVLVLGLLGHLDLQTLLYAYIGSFAAPGIWVLFNGWSGIRLFGSRTGATIREMYHFGKYSVGTTLGANLFRVSDTWIINFLLGPGALAVYNIGQRPLELVEIPLRSLAATGMPELSAAYNGGRRQEVIRIMKGYAGMLTWILVPFGLIAVLLADVGIGIIGGAQYQQTEAGYQAANVFRLFMTFALLFPVDRFMALTLDVIHQPKINFYKVLLMLAVNVAFDFLGVALWKNVYGVALASLFPTLVGVGIGYWALNRYLHFSFTSIYATGLEALRGFVRNSRFSGKLWAGK